MVSKVNVLYIIEELELGGAEKVVIDQARALDRQRYHAICCCLRYKGDFAYALEREGIEVIELGKKPKLDFSIIGKIQKLLKERNIHIVHTHLWVANLWGRVAAVISGVPVVVTEHNVDVWKKWYHKLADRMLEPFTKSICVVSNQVKKFYIEEIGLPESKLRVVYNGIEVKDEAVDSQKLQQLRKEFHLENGRYVLANIGRLVEAKANHFFIEALEKLDAKGMDFHALIIGDGPLKEKYVECGKDLISKGKLTFTGLRKDVQEILELTNLSVLSSTREGLPITLLESMLKKIPVVVTDVGGNKELVVDQKTGYIVPPRNPKALADAMEKILTNTALAHDMGECALQRIKDHFSLESMVNETQNVYEEVLKS